MEVEDHKAVEESTRFLSLSFCLWWYLFLVLLFDYDSGLLCPSLIYCRRTNILGIRVKREFGENETKVQVFCIFLFASALHFSRPSVIIIQLILHPAGWWQSYIWTQRTGTDGRRHWFLEASSCKYYL
jgi:hypothetical protein